MVICKARKSMFRKIFQVVHLLSLACIAVIMTLIVKAISFNAWDTVVWELAFVGCLSLANLYFYWSARRRERYSFDAWR